MSVCEPEQQRGQKTDGGTSDEAILQLIAEAELELEDLRSRAHIKQSMLAELSRGIINFSYLKKRNMKREEKGSHTIKLSARNSGSGRILNADHKIYFPLILAQIAQNPHQECQEVELKMSATRVTLQSARPIVCYGDSDILQMMFEQQ